MTTPPNFNRYKRRFTAARAVPTTSPFRQTTIDYANNLVVSPELGASADRFITDFIDYPIMRELVGLKKEESARRTIRAKFNQYLRTHPPHPPRSPGDPIGANLARFGEIFGLDEIDVQIFTFLMIRRDSSMLSSLLEPGCESEQGRFLAAVLAQPIDKVVEAISPADFTLPGSSKIGAVLRWKMRVRVAH